MSEGTRFCDWCSRPIRGEAETIIPFSASGARPNSYRHKKGDPECQPRRDPGMLRPRGR
ncbi:hypothetical protein QCN29_11615 [Streptomyces sp. HNM0663]|uniref:Uncharacterized protein n=1 Tax=Streptomyces chengmaiensis TaxID=3040919 RepID=A0ABT6HL28_9ACTN|nr:hypothetical protein [Streptomyces chengmaiensis]MDH2389043.1 hypothetical protein [Streptomyces chengmaiensis]MDH2389430.1 hypothetical protein [Streptomyces chengmaiensis]